MPPWSSDLNAHRKHLRAAKRLVVKEIRALVDKHLKPRSGYCGLVCGFFPEAPKADGSHKRERKLRNPIDVTGIMGFTDTGVIDDIFVGLSTIEYTDLSIETLIKLLPLARKFDEYHRKAIK